MNKSDAIALMKQNKTRKQCQLEFKQLMAEVDNQTTGYLTHDQFVRAIEVAVSRIAGIPMAFKLNSNTANAIAGWLES